MVSMVEVGIGLVDGGVEGGDVLPVEDGGDGLPVEGVGVGLPDGEALLCN